jgi:hypothetical protein
MLADRGSYRPQERHMEAPRQLHTRDCQKKRADRACSVGEAGRFVVHFCSVLHTQTRKDQAMMGTVCAP